MFYRLTSPLNYAIESFIEPFPTQKTCFNRPSFQLKNTLRQGLDRIRIVPRKAQRRGLLKGQPLKIRMLKRRQHDVNQRARDF